VPEARRPLQVAVISHLYPSRTRENYGVFVYEQCRALVESGCAVLAIAAPTPLAPFPLPLLSASWRRYAETERARTDFGGVPVEYPRYASFPRKSLRATSAKSAVRAIEASAPLSEAMRACDVIISHTALLDGTVANALSRKLDTPYVVFVHGEDLYQNASSEKPQLRAIVHDALLGAHTVIAVSELVRDGLLHEFPDLERIAVLPNGVDTELFSPDARTEDAAGPLRVFSAGRLVESKGHRFVLRSLAELTAEGLDIQYTIAGDGPLRSALEALTAEMGLTDRVTFTGAYRHEELPALLREADLFVLPGWPEAFGVVYLESLASGIPVVAAADGGAKGFVSEGVNGYLVRHADPQDISRSIRTFATLDVDGRRALGAAARATALEYTWQRNALGLTEILHEVVASLRITHPPV